MPVVDDLIWKVVFKGWDKWGNSIAKTAGDLKTVDQQVEHTQKVIDSIGRKNLTLGSAGAIREAEVLAQRIQTVQARYLAYKQMMEQRAASGQSLRGYATQFVNIQRELERTKQQFKTAQLNLPKTNLDAYVNQVEHYRDRISELKQEMSSLAKQKVALSPTWEQDIKRKADEVKQLQYAIKQMPAFPSKAFQGGQTFLSPDQIKKFEFLNSQLKIAESHFTTIGMQARRISSDVGSVATQWGYAFLATAGALAVAGVKAGTFQKRMAEVNSITHYSAQEFEVAKRQVLDLYGDVVTTNMDDFTKGLYNIRSSGVEAADSINVLGKSAKAAAAGQTDLDTASKAGLSTINAWNLPMSRLNEVFDYQFKLVDKGIGRYKDFQPVLARVQSAARLAGQSIGDTYAVLAQLTRQGMSPRLAAMAETRLMTAMVQQRGRIQKYTGIDTVDKSTGRYKSIVQFLDEIAKKTKAGTLSAQDLSKAFSQTNSLQAVTLLTGAIEKMNKMAMDFNPDSVTGSMEEAYKKATDNIEDQLKLAKQKFEVMMVDIGNSPAVKSAFKGLITSMESVSKFFKNNNLAGPISWLALITAAATGGGFAFMKFISIAARGVGAMYSLRGAIASVGILELSRNMQTATATFQGMGMAATEASGAALLLKGALIGLQVAAVAAAAAVGWAIGTWLDKQINGVIYDQQKLGAQSIQLAQEFRIVGSAAIEGSNAFRRKNEILQELGKNFPDLVAKLKNGKISMDQFADAVQRAGTNMTQLRTASEELFDNMFFGGKGGKAATPEAQDPYGAEQLKSQLKTLVDLRDRLEKGERIELGAVRLRYPEFRDMKFGKEDWRRGLTVEDINKNIRATRRQAITFFDASSPGRADEVLGRRLLGSQYGKMNTADIKNARYFQTQVNEMTAAGLDQATARLATAAHMAAADPGKYKEVFGKAADAAAGMCARGVDQLVEQSTGMKVPGADARDIFNKAAGAAAGFAKGVVYGGEAQPGDIVVTRKKGVNGTGGYHIGVMDTAGKMVETPTKGAGVGYRGKGRSLEQFTEGWARDYYVIRGAQTYSKLLKGTLYKPTSSGPKPGNLAGDQSGIGAAKRLDSLYNDLQNQIRKAKTDAEIASMRGQEPGANIHTRQITGEAAAKKKEIARDAQDQINALKDRLNTELEYVKGNESKKSKVRSAAAQLEIAINNKAKAEIARVDRDTQRKLDVQLAQDSLDRIKYQHQINGAYRKAQSEYLSITATTANADLEIMKSEYLDKMDSILENFIQAKIERNKQIAEGILPEGDKASWDAINNAFNQQKANAQLEYQKNLKKRALEIYDTEMSGYADLRRANFEMYRDITLAANDSFSNRLSMIQQETDLQIKELDEQRAAYERNADFQKKTETERANDRAKFAAEEKALRVKSALEQRDAAIQQIETALTLAEKLYGSSNRAAFTQKPSDTLAGVNDITPKATQNLMEFARVYDHILAQAGVSSEERADKFLGYISTSIEKDKQRLNFYLDMLELPRQKVIEIRNAFIRDGLFIGDEVIQAEQDNLRDLMQPMIEFQSTLKDGFRDAFKGLITGEDDLVSAGQKIMDSYKEAVANYITDEVLMPLLNPAFMTPEQRALQDKMAWELQYINYQRDIQSLQSLAVQSFNNGVTAFQKSVNDFVAASASAVPDGQAPGLPFADILGGLEGGGITMPMAAGATPADQAASAITDASNQISTAANTISGSPTAQGSTANPGVMASAVALGFITASKSSQLPGGNAGAPATTAGIGGLPIPISGPASATDIMSGRVKLGTTDSIMYGLGVAGSMAGVPGLGVLSQIAASPGGFQGAWGRSSNGLGNVMTGVGGFMSGYSEAAQTGHVSGGNVIMSGLTGFATGGPIGGLIGVGSSLIGGLFGKGKHKSEPPKPKDLQQLQGPEDVMWSTKRYIRNAAEGGREGLPLALGTRANQTNINTNTTVNFARIEIVSADPRGAGSQFVAGMTEGTAKVLTGQLNASPSVR
jgi:TP901 family phage tail tape measure protein